MRTSKLLSIAFLSSLTLLPGNARAADSDGFGQVFNMFWGTESVRQNMKNCVFTDGDQNQGIIGGVNSFFCHLDKDMGITAATGAAGITKSFGSMSVHAVVLGAAGGASYGGYDYQAQVWFCKQTASVTCKNASDFNKAIYVQFSYKSDKTVNKGTMLQDSGVMSGQASGVPVLISWDVGTASTSRSVTVKVANFNSGMKLSGLSTISGTVVTAAMEMVSASAGMRFAAAFDTSTNQVAASFSSTTTSNTTKNDTITFTGANCFNRTSASGDWTYTPASNCNLSGVTMPSESISDMNTSWSSASAFWTAVGNAGLTNMSQNPSSI